MRRGEPVSLGLRAPGVLDAIRRASTTGTTQRAEFDERVPVEDLELGVDWLRHAARSLLA